ncbi:MAG: sulfate reduction electron transfer complex DsrMKJOP subunit DsrO [Halorhodospira sp.]
MSEEQPNRVSRRRVLGSVAALAGLSLAPGVSLIQARAPAEGADAGVRWGLLVDTTRCPSDCDACITACREEHGWPPGNAAEKAQWIRKMHVGDHDSDGAQRTLPMMCQHCAEPPCVSVCPTTASFQRADGIVLVDKHRCIGCRYCMMACPFQARSFVHAPVTEPSPNHPRGRGTVEACNLCVHRIDRGEPPACVERCTRQGHAALIFGDLNDPASEIRRALHERGGAPLRGDLGVDPGVRYHGIS